MVSSHDWTMWGPCCYTCVDDSKHSLLYTCLYFKQGGVYVLQIMDHYVAAWSLLMIGLCEVLAVTHVSTTVNTACFIRAYILNREACTFYRLWIITWQHGLFSWLDFVRFLLLHMHMVSNLTSSERGLYFVVQYLMSFLVLQYSRWGHYSF